MNRDDLLTELAMGTTPWQFKGIEGYFCREYKGSKFQLWEYILRRQELINCPPDSEALSEAAEYRTQDANGEWWWHELKPFIVDECEVWDSDGWQALAGKGAVPKGHDWRTTLTRIHRDDNTSTPEEEAEFDRIQARQDADKPHEADARMLDAQLERDIATFREVYKIADDECAQSYGKPNANSILNAAAQHMQDRAATYDKPEGERSMAATVEAFRATTGIELTEEQGWHFMALLKLVRSQQGDYRADSYEDGAAYLALAGEAAAKERVK